VVIDLLKTGKIRSFTLFDALSVLMSCESLISDDEIRQFLSVILNALVKTRNEFSQTLALELLVKFGGRSPAITAELFLEDEKRFASILHPLDGQLLAKLQPLFQLFTDSRQKLFSLLITAIKSEPLHRVQVAQYFRLVLAVFDESCDRSAALDFCLPLLDETHSSIFPDLSKLLNRIMEVDPQLCLSHRPLFDQLLEMLFRTDSSTSQKSLLGLMAIFRGQSESYQLAFIAVLREKFSRDFDRWGYKPESHVKSSTGLTGIRNLRATCYINAVFQQLFFNRTFRARFLQADPLQDWQVALRSIFLKLALTKRPFVDPTPFTSLWRDPEGILINPRFQADAMEFLELLLDRLGDTLHMGRLARIFEADGFYQSMPQDFWTVPFVVKGCKTMATSIQRYLEKEQIADYKVESLGRAINVTSYSRISVPPEFLIVHLQRFAVEYTPSIRRKKLTERFEFEHELELGPLMADETQNPMYRLTGIVLHAGTAEGGHYTSYVKVGQKWYDFNDTQVLEIPESAVLENAAGNMSFGGEDHRPCAYLLFYQRSDVTQELTDDYLQLPQDVEIREEIERDNRMYQELQSLFATPMTEVVVRQSGSVHALAELKSPSLMCPSASNRTCF
jgi:hypothetical protein